MPMTKNDPGLMSESKLGSENMRVLVGNSRGKPILTKK